MAAEAESMLAKVTLECGDITASQEETLAGSAFLGGLPASPSASDSDEEVFSTPPDATQQQDDDPVTMCTLPFTPTPSKSPAAPPADSGPSSDDAPPANPRRKPRLCTRKVRGARIRTPTPTPSPEQQPQPKHQPQQPEQQQPQAEEPSHVDPLIRAVLTMPTRTTTATTGTTSNQDPVEAFLALARRKGLI